MKAIADLFIARSRNALFWFAVTCAAPIATGMYVQERVATVRTLPQFVMAGEPTLHWLTVDPEPDILSRQHTWQTQLAMEALYNRNPNGSDHPSRRYRMFTKEVNEFLNERLLKPEVLPFRDTNTFQKVEIERIQINQKEGKGEATTLAVGQLFRTGIENGVAVNKSFSVKVLFTWKLNPNVSERARYPTLCTDVTLFSNIQTFP